MECTLKCLPLNTARLLSSGQVATSTSACVKELLENSLDAGAQNITIKIQNFGLDLIEVKDDGCGISYDNVQKMFLPGFTSKISEFSHLGCLTTYGFRGEALAAICRLSEVSLTTKTPTDNLAMTYVINQQGSPVSSSPAALDKGTILTIKNLFKALPVRKQFASSKKTMKDELKKIEHVVQTLAVINPTVRVVLMHNKSVIWQKNKVDNLKKSFMQLVGLKTVTKLEFLENSDQNIKMVCAVLKKETVDLDGILGSSSNSFCFVNQRPVAYSKISKVLEEAVKLKFCTEKYAANLVVLEVDPSNVDVNLEPDKSKVLLNNEEHVLNILRTAIEKYYGFVLEKPAAPTNLTEEPIEELEEIPAKRSKYDKYLDGVESESNEKTAPKTISSIINTSNNIATPSEINDLNIRLQGQNQLVNLRTVPQLERTENIGLAADIHEVSKLVDETLADDISTQQLFERTLDGLFSSSKRPELGIANWSRGEFEVDGKRLQPGARLVAGVGLERHNVPKRSKEGDTTLGVSSGGKPVVEAVMLPSTPVSNLASSREQERLDIQSIAEMELYRTPVVTRQNVLEAISSPVPNVALSHQSNVTGNISNGLDKTNLSAYDGTTVADGSVLEKTGRTNDFESDVSKFDLSRESVCSQLQRKEHSGFTKFAALERSKIIQENPGIPFTHVSKLLTEKWEQLTNDDQEYYHSLAQAVDKKKKAHREEKSLRERSTSKELKMKQIAALKPRPERKEVELEVSVHKIVVSRRSADGVDIPHLIGKWSDEFLGLLDNAIGFLRIRCISNDESHIDTETAIELLKEHLSSDFTNSMCRHNKPFFSAIHHLQPPLGTKHRDAVS